MPGPGCSVSERDRVVEYKIQMGDLVTGFVSLETGYRGSFIMDREGDIYRIFGVQPTDIRPDQKLEVQRFGNVFKEAHLARFFESREEWCQIT